MNMWLVGAGYWGTKLIDNLKKFDITATTIDIRDGQTIDNINDQAPVMLATPAAQHCEQACKLLAKGHDVYVEKPMAMTLDQVEKINNCLQPGQLLMVGHLFIHHPQLQVISDLISAGTIGNLTHITSQRLNWGIYQTAIDPLLTLATHDISIVLALANNVVAVQSATAWNYSSNSQPDRVWFSGTCGAVTFDIDVSWHWPARVRQTLLIGTQGQIVWDQDSNIVTVFKNKIEFGRAVIDNTPQVYQYDYELSPLECEIEHWINCLHSRQEPKTNIESARLVAQVIDQVQKLI